MARARGAAVNGNTDATLRLLSRMKALTSSECKRKAASPLVLGSNAGEEAVSVLKKISCSARYRRGERGGNGLHIPRVCPCIARTADRRGVISHPCCSRSVHSAPRRHSTRTLNSVCRLVEKRGASCVILGRADGVAGKYLAHIQKLARWRGVRTILIAPDDGRSPSIALGSSVGLKSTLAVALRSGGGEAPEPVRSLVQEVLSKAGDTS